MALQELPKVMLYSILVFLDDITFINITSITSKILAKHKKIKSLYDLYNISKIQNINYNISFVEYDKDIWDAKLIPISCIELTLQKNIKGMDLNDCKHVIKLDLGLGFYVSDFIKILPDHITRKNDIKLNALSNSIMTCMLAGEINNALSKEFSFKKSYIHKIKKSITNIFKELENYINIFRKYSNAKDEVNLQLFMISVPLEIKKIINKKYACLCENKEIIRTKLQQLLINIDLFLFEDLYSEKVLLDLILKLYMLFGFNLLFIEAIESAFLKKYNMYASIEEYNKIIK